MSRSSAAPDVNLSAEQFQRITRALDEPSRYGMLREIYASNTTTCGAVSTALGLNTGTASHHLRMLEDADLVRVTKVGRYKMLSPRRDVWKAFLAELKTL